MPRYEIRVGGRIPALERPEFEGMSISEADGVTTLAGDVVDQAALHGMLDRIEILGLRLLEIRQGEMT